MLCWGRLAPESLRWQILSLVGGDRRDHSHFRWFSIITVISKSINLPITFAIKVGHGVVAGTTSSAYASGPWLGLPDRYEHLFIWFLIWLNKYLIWFWSTSPGVTLVDSPGFNSSIADMEELVWLLSDLQQAGSTFLFACLSVCLFCLLVCLSFCLSKTWRSLSDFQFWSPHSKISSRILSQISRKMLSDVFRSHVFTAGWPLCGDLQVWG